MSTTWRRLIVFLVCVIAVLQVIHMTLLSRLEARKSNNQRRGMGNAIWQHNEKSSQVASLKQSRDLMYEHIHQSSVLDSSGEFRIVNNLARSDISNSRSQDPQDVTLVTQCTANHLQHIPMLASRWKGPISVAIFALTSDIPFVIESVLLLCQCFPDIKTNTSFHLVYPLNSPNLDSAMNQPLENAVDQCQTLLETLQKILLGKNYSHKVPYPNNLLRNVARHNSVTEFIFILDTDMVPNVNLHQEFVDFAMENRLFLDSHKDDKTVYVVPAFEMKESDEIPREKTTLLQLIELMEARPFYFELCWKCQKHTDYEAWQREPLSKKLSVIFEVLWRDPWEPFFFSRNTAPYHDERFRQYGFNRISQVCELHVAGYKFSVLNNAFVIHKGIKTASSFHKDKDADQEKNRLLFRQFKTELKEKYPDSSRRCY